MQTKLESILEVLINVSTGFIVAMLVWKFVIPVFWPRMAGPMWENFFITALFTISSVGRGYLWRRFFNGKWYVILADKIRLVTGGRKG